MMNVSKSNECLPIAPGIELPVRPGEGQVHLVEKSVQHATGLAALWTQPIATAIDLVRDAHRSALDAGDLDSACATTLLLIDLLLLSNAPLDLVWRESESAIDFLRKNRFREAERMVVTERRFIAAMQGRTASFPSFSDGQFEEAAFEAQLTRDGMTPMAGRYWTRKLQARYLAGDYTQAQVAADNAQAPGAGAGPVQAIHACYYGALTAAALFDEAGAGAQDQARQRLAAHLEQLREWSEQCPSSLGGKHALVAAEIARLEGRDADAMGLYDAAIVAARANGFVLDEAIACERGAAFYRARGLSSVAGMALREARNAYARWGADGKLRQLDERDPQLLARQPGPARANPLDAVTQRDLLAVATASQAISSQIEFDELVDTLMRVVLEDAGAQAGSLLLVRDEQLVLAADASVEARTGQVSVRREAAAPGLRVPAAILEQVRRSREKLVLGDLAQPHPFATDPYFTRDPPRSLLCLPILRQGALLGVLYLENRLVTQAFTPNRLAVLELLASQAAISLENAFLYADLRAREARIRRLVESNIIGIFIWDAHGGVREANDALLQMLGYARDELLCGKMRWTDLTPREYRAADMRAIEELERTGSCIPYEKEFIAKDGAHVPVLVGAAFFEQSHETGVAFVLDLSERKRAEAALRYSEEQWRAVFDHNPTMYFMLDPDGVIVAVNPVGAVQLGYTVDELVGQSVFNVFHEADRAFIKENVAIVLAHPERTTRWEVRKIRKNGTELWVRETVKVMPRANQRPLVLVVCEDITARREAQDELRRSAAFLAEGQRISHTGSWGWHVATGKLVWSEEHYRIFGVASGTALTLALFLSRIHPADRTLVERRLDEAVRAQSGFDFPFRIVRDDGGVRHLQGIGRPVLAADGALEEFIGTTMDITERKRADDALLQAHEELEARVRERTRELQQSNEQLASEVGERIRAEQVLAQRSQELARSNGELEQMAYVASHDLQEPLRMVASYLQLLEQRYGNRLDADAHEFIGFAVDGARRLQTLIDDLLAYSRVGTRAKPLEPTDCTEVAQAAQRALRLAIAESGAQIECAPLPVVMGDPAQLAQLFQNLLANAIKFHGQAVPKVVVWAEPEDGFWRFAVQDNGIGIAPEYFDRIFVMFQRLHSRSKYPGTGMGLAICRKIVERHGGRIWVEAAPQGAIFKFTLPRASGGKHG